jgi:hypothetical protein
MAFSGHQDAQADEVPENFPQLSNPADRQRMVATLAENTIEAVLRPDRGHPTAFSTRCHSATLDRAELPERQRPAFLPSKLQTAFQKPPTPMATFSWETNCWFCRAPKQQCHLPESQAGSFPVCASLVLRLVLFSARCELRPGCSQNNVNEDSLNHGQALNKSIARKDPVFFVFAGCQSRDHLHQSLFEGQFTGENRALPQQLPTIQFRLFSGASFQCHCWV